VTDTVRIDYLEAGFRKLAWTKKSWHMQGDQAMIVYLPPGEEMLAGEKTYPTLREAVDSRLARVAVTTTG